MHFNSPHPAISRRQVLQTTACGFGYLAFAGLSTEAHADYRDPLALKMLHFAPRAKRVIMLFMDGGPSHMDTFDYKPQLQKDHGKKGRKKATLYGSPWKFRQRGESGQWASELFPQLVEQHIDDLCIVKSMHADSSAHPFAVPFFHTGSFRFTRPSVGSWVLYGLGTENKSLPGFVTINPSKELGGPQNFGSAFLPQCYQGTRIGWMGKSVRNVGIQNIESDFLPGRLRRAQMDLVQSLNQEL
ncbi:MAG: DUF1501 domain-containing protein, partial [Planctomycetaceae bacterium]|nr:DUF1501 domain-containing protein [Planctomycetaceae bacterium]